MDIIDKYISEKKYKEAMEECLRKNQYYLGLMIAYSINSIEFINEFSKLINKTNLEQFQIIENHN
jgi:hypothetical protein